MLHQLDLLKLSLGPFGFAGKLLLGSVMEVCISGFAPWMCGVSEFVCLQVREDPGLHQVDCLSDKHL